MTTLYELNNEYKEAIAVLENGEFDEQTIRDTLDGLAGCVEDKAINTAQYIKNLEAFNDAISTEINRLRDRKASIERKAEKLKKYVVDSMNLVGKKKITDAILTLSIRKSQSLEIIDADKIPEQFFRIKTTKEPDKSTLKEVIATGHCVDGVTLVEKNNLLIK